MISIGGRIFGNFFAVKFMQKLVKKITGMAHSGILNELQVRDFD